ncbi:hypothetical protein P3X46_029348 [Hevea brasiliensis]|uniref:Protein kinase domain-containing protein n=2 Tax=Hevea brasiliensis TaxID=3981 RepID=A0ABQ9KTM5_HEVBR|nr:hypothetical protein P3X46_029348 [Hevea brasiliensis]
MSSMQSFSSLPIHAIAFLLCIFLLTSASNGNDTDQLALLKFKANINQDPLGVLNSWNDTTHFCQWHGVSCGSRHQRVTALDLRSLKLSGSISSFIGNLSFLRELRLQNNSFGGEIPPQIVNLRRLEILALHNNSIAGKIPANISRCTNLISFRVHYNLLEGGIPMELGVLLKIQYLSLAHNRFVGTIPPSLGNATSLQIFYAYENTLSGDVPATLCQLKNLSILALSDNHLSGNFPPCIFNVSSLMTLDVGANLVHGSLSSELGISLPNLQFFSISLNQFTGFFPASLSNASNLQVFEIDDNKIVGKVPSFEKLYMINWLTMNSNHLGTGEADDDMTFLSSLANGTNLEYLDLGFNNFGGKLPEQISNFSRKLSVLVLDENQIFGNIPPGIENLANLKRFSAWHNKLSGVIPSTIGRLQSLEILYLTRNNFSGSIPPSLGNLTIIDVLGLGQNYLHGNIPVGLGNCQRLSVLDLSGNNLSGTIPPQIIGLSSFKYTLLDFSFNHFTGVLPMEVGSLKNLQNLDVSNNMLSGEIPSSLGSCTSLEELLMEGNAFQGRLPSSLGLLQGLQKLDLSRNNLSGQIPEALAGLRSLEILNLSYNNFEGAVPMKGVFTNASATSVVGNGNLCGGIPQFHLPKCPTFNKPKKRLSLQMKIIISVISVLLGLILVLTYLFLSQLRKKRREIESNSDGNALLMVSYQSLRNATNGFSSANLIGTGSFGSVYKGILGEEGMVIAVKVLNLMHQGASRSFIAECEALKNIRHRNLLKLITACSSVDYHGNDFKALIYEFMPNGSLEEWLHPNLGLNEATKSLNLLQRLDIAIHVASALEYLHHYCESTIVHCDLKPSNILLDNEMIGHVGDFGLAKIFLEGTLQPSTNQSISTGVKGTIGYTPPEYGMGSEVSTYGDIYSYGILLLEMFTGKKPTDSMFGENLNLPNFVKRSLPEQVAQSIDPILLQENKVTNSTQSNWRSIRNNEILECFTSIFEIGIACSVEMPSMRMNISHVATQLSSARKKLFGMQIR